MRATTAIAAFFFGVTTWATAQPILSLVGPDTGLEGGGDTVFIFGEGLNATTRVTFGDTDALSVTLVSDVLLQAVTPRIFPPLPPNSSLAVDVTVFTAGGSGTAANGFVYDSNPTFGSSAPPIIAINPTELPMIAPGGRTQSVRVTNVGPRTLIWEAAVIEGDDFISLSNVGSLSGETFDVTIAENLGGEREGLVRISGGTVDFVISEPVDLLILQDAATAAGCIGGSSTGDVPFGCESDVLSDADGKGSLVPTTLVVSVWDEETGEGILDALVELEGAAFFDERDGSPNGAYAFAGLEAGSYDLRVDVPGRALCIDTVSLRANGITAASVGVLPEEEAGKSLLGAAMAPNAASGLLLLFACLALFGAGVGRPTHR